MFQPSLATAARALAVGLLVGLGEDLAPAAFVVEGAPVAVADVGLVADHLVVVGDALGAELDAGVDVLVAGDLELQAQVEVLEALGGGEELVARGGLVGGAGDDGRRPRSARCVLVSPSQPSKVLPSKRETGSALVVTMQSARAARVRGREVRFMVGGRVWRLPLLRSPGSEHFRRFLIQAASSGRPLQGRVIVCRAWVVPSGFR